MKLLDLQIKMGNIPVIVSNNKESLLCLQNDFHIIDDKEICDYIDSPQKILAKNNYILLSENRKCLRRFPRIGIKEPFWSFSFDDNLASKFELAKKLFLTQSRIKDVIQEESAGVDFVVFIIVDGLSFTDCLNWKNVRPCLVDTVTTTEFGFRNIVGEDKPISHRLFDKGYHKFIGFSYWEKDHRNELTDFTFRGFSTVNKIQSIKEVQKYLKKEVLKKTYVQIVTSGLDGLAHECREEPLIEENVKQLTSNIEYIREGLENTKLKGLLYVSSDHGILWKHRKKLKKIPFEFAKKSHSARFYNGTLTNLEGMVFSDFGKNVVSLKSNYLLRELRTNEWGVHGGVSLEESIVPFATIKIN